MIYRFINYPKCNQRRLLQRDFYERKDSKSGYRSHCKKCTNEKTMERYYKDKASHHKAARKHLLRTKYGITEEDYDVLYNEQGGRCVICGIHSDQINYKLCVDHNHNTGKVRGLLCKNCNSGIGKLKDSIFLLKRATEYLEIYDG